ncbi:MAG: TIGR00159 family protein [Bdellovibrionales bacterium GWC1_52_8]|nr:MAG: TIGR00159 family protein [Bdellovibrionales bacterium GWB1_52_6]OFZ06143.1 MAG: TIGR00159 family protein [Bdellovibrionales bacterium GWA1_52_35]OFZ33068.1 MAG: TIGR00159 family protein [Bdellovibrionales bacterium GWC1_52_8]
MDVLLNLQSSLRLIDFLDIAIVAFILYRLLLLIKGTRAMQMLTGLGILGIGFFLSSTLELFTTHWLLSYFFDYLILIVIVLFQDDLRRALTHVGKNPFFAGASAEEERENVDEIARAATRLARERIGGLIVLERETGLKNFIDTGSKLDAKVKSELLYSIFIPDSPIHDGAVIITNGRVAAAGCFLPLSKDPNIDKRYGTRHRAALGLTEDTDAIVVLISEEAGEAHLVKNGKITINLNEQEIRQSLAALLDLSRSNRNLSRKLRSWMRAVQGSRTEE